MKILFLANRIPYPPYRGDKLKIYNLAKRLKDKHELYLLTFAQSQEEFEYKEKLEEIFKEVHLIYLPKWRSAVNCLTALWNSMPLQVLYFKSAAMQQQLDSVNINFSGAVSNFEQALKAQENNVTEQGEFQATHLLREKFNNLKKTKLYSLKKNGL